MGDPPAGIQASALRNHGAAQRRIQFDPQVLRGAQQLHPAPWACGLGCIREVSSDCMARSRPCAMRPCAAGAVRMVFSAHPPQRGQPGAGAFMAWLASNTVLHRTQR
jgi:hypothetical protein